MMCKTFRDFPLPIEKGITDFNQIEWRPQDAAQWDLQSVMLGNWESVVRELLSSKPEVITQLEQGAEAWMEVQEVPSCTYLCRSCVCTS
ncbi:PREDICTED: zinc finger protein 485-like [Hipposideros armiger]|uniref:Zinc finger protein 485-like n=1 Tax=Hipposideros armiger TaxID=186990 RepID=A0A8B7T8Y0_HIPAR|nr:PREDICTED: zinc finger protein 485-like [Hipposideros armiger]